MAGVGQGLAINAEGSSHMKRSWITRLVILTVAYAVLTSGMQAGQSGRKIPKRESPSESQPPAKEDPSPAEPEKPKLSIVVTRSVFSGGVSEGFYSASVTAGCLERLNKTYVKAAGAGEMNRKEASDFAKQTESTYVTWIEIGTTSVGRPQYGTADLQNTYVEYVLYSPRTGKSKSSGRVYLAEMARMGNVGVGLPIPSNTGTVDYACNRAGREIADRVLSALGVAVPRNHVPIL
jgi:hypothetical protein